MNDKIREIEKQVEEELVGTLELWLKDSNDEVFQNSGSLETALIDSVQFVLEERKTEDTLRPTDDEYFLHVPLRKDYFKYNNETIEEYKKFLNFEHPEDFEPRTFRCYREHISFHRVQMFIRKLLKSYT